MSGIHMAAMSTAGPTATYQLNGGTYTDFAIDPDTANVLFEVNSNGTVNISTNYNGNTSYDWITPKPPGATHYIRVQTTSGTFSSSSTLNSWVAISSFWSGDVVRDTLGSKLVTFTVEIATDSGGSNVVATASVSLQATQEL